MDGETQVEVKLALCIERIDALYKMLNDHMAEEDIDRREVRDELRSISKMLTQYRGTLGGVVLTLTAVASVVAIGWSWITGKVGYGGIDMSPHLILVAVAVIVVVYLVTRNDPEARQFLLRIATRFFPWR